MGDWSRMNPDMGSPDEGNPGGGSPSGGPGGDWGSGDSGNNGNDVKPVSLSKKKVAVVLVAVLVLGIIVITMIQSCSIRRNVNSGSNSQTPQVTITEAPKNPTNTGENGVKIEETGGENGSPVGSRGESSNSAVSGNDKQGDVSEEPDVVETTREPEVGKEVKEDSESEASGVSEGLVEVAEPVLGDVWETTGMVSSKNIYTWNDSSYVYSVDLVLLTGDSQTVTVEYFCPRKTFDALNTADSLSVQYQMDSDGVISIVSVAR